MRELSSTLRSFPGKDHLIAACLGEIKAQSWKGFLERKLRAGLVGSDILREPFVPSLQLSPEDFMDGIAAMLRELIQTYRPIPNAAVLFPSELEIVGKCPRCGKNVVEKKPGYFCEDRNCGFALWKNSKFFTAKKKQLTPTIVAALLKDRKAKLTGCYSEKTGKTYDAVVVLKDDGKQVSFELEFSKGGK